ncbi:hypothetical protein M406DRAFT_296888 [Cryphonectria parasitica EP155]|uniref:Uncharacterized protein n=1 Tax=Cryphonectria parasitica (strain ATCC 38755 / EP155) TaxID=660469 RepID=A0A9P5CJJ2_CRYP1|nr:uncharacterized protein M406DRAFT_296888 [Cryphonectria parasitica EP155]KAF3760202.1 hypothetical protein M406DRAFT_296888 [Cryphonectria parasitica EP155]
MDDNTRRRRQNETPLQHNTNRYHQTVQNPTQQQAHRTMTGSSSDRYRPAPINTSPPAAGRAGLSGSSAGYGTYYQEPSATNFPTATGMQQNTMGYHQSATGYGQDARQTQSFAGSYNPNLMYNVPQAGAQSAVYDTTGSQFDLRQPAAQQIMPTDVTNTYFSGEPTNATAASALQQQQPSSAQTTAVYQSGSADTRNTLMNYPSNITGMGTMATQATTTAPDVSMEESGDYQAGADLNQAYSQYQDALKEIFSNIKKGALQTAGESLSNVSEWLLSHVHELGLTSDDQSLHSDRIKLWNDFNHAWLAMFQAQKDLMESGMQLSRNQSLVTDENLQKMGDELVRLCDNIERHGLVDYQYGVWETQIIDILEECKELYKSEDTAAASSSSR